ncbi:BTAD domain-containing putative transcriptional regulator [Lentzea flaviverrucosa]|uniref:Two-component response regulator, SAPR family, consists of REC, wHTH and BTAD domains n=1 Tax=Lentzea flaviverrucosa TaxID=200379 RepID=A0A1H9SKU8_9PSEU|nr:BTAD domain-containing putative transcriptional regulator [Lentzea flaviverrucosa]RDI25419.1 two-component SAPR family response regulator [Lentzea flaviverrucosa]SER85636.1 Two-component response regulator, SAPR family, consists of REC, wHTH and BTAD domains [Lentzea flaviverrucosa]
MTNDSTMALRVTVLACVRLVRGSLALVALSTLVAGLPWALAHFVGWPLPDHLPTWDETQATLLNPMSSQLFINLLAIVCWISWLCFVLAVLRSIIDVLRGMTWEATRARGPLQALASTLIGAVVLTLLTNRALATTPVAGPDVRFHEPTSVRAVAPTVPGPVAQNAALPAETELVIDRVAPAPPGLVRVVDEIRLPHDGIYDSLWRVAERVYGPGGGERWPELFQLNCGVVQADGRSLTNPDLVRPGWKIAAYVPELAGGRPSQQLPPSTNEAPSTATAPAQVEQVAEPRDDQAVQGVDLMPAVYMSAGLAGAISAVLVATQMRRRRRYQLGSGERADLRRPTAPAVRALQVVCQNFDPSRREIRLIGAGETESYGGPMLVPAAVGSRPGGEFAVNLASTRGIGLAGPGATAAVRALLLHILAKQQGHENLRVLVPAQDLHLLFEGLNAERLPKAVEVANSLDAALDEMEANLLTRARRADGEPRTPSPAVVLVACPAAHAERRLQAVLDNGSTLGLAGILLGQWRPGATVVVRADGTVSATSSGLGDAFAGARLFHLPATEAADLLTVLREAEIDLGVPGTSSGDQADLEPRPSVPQPRPRVVADNITDAAASAEPRLLVKVFGRFELVFVQADSEVRELNGLLTPKHREVLVHLALHPQGVRREALNEAVWPDSRPPRPYNSFHNALSVLRRVLADATDGVMTDLVLNDDGRYRLNDELADVDLWQFRRALQGSQLQTAVDLYTGDLAEDLSSPWLEPLRESARRDVLDALGALISEHGGADPKTELLLLERARKLDQYNEGVYRDIMRTQARLGQHSAVPRTLALLTATLSEIDAEPSVDTCNLAELLRQQTVSVDRAAAS